VSSDWQLDRSAEHAGPFWWLCLVVPNSFGFVLLLSSLEYQFSGSTQEMLAGRLALPLATGALDFITH
jgi:hypothetical protein